MGLPHTFPQVHQKKECWHLSLPLTHPAAQVRLTGVGNMKGTLAQIRTKSSLWLPPTLNNTCICRPNGGKIFKNCWPIRTPFFKDHRVISALHRNKNLRDALVKAKFCRQVGGDQGETHRAFKQLTFLYNTHGGTGTSITGRFTLHTHNIIYCIRCTTCNKRHVGETGNSLLDRLKQPPP